MVALSFMECAQAAGNLRLRFVPRFGAANLHRDTSYYRGDLPPVAISRLDLLLSRLALQKPDGSWLESADWFAYISLGNSRLEADSDGVPELDFKAIRFDIGLPDDVDRLPPTNWPAGHALNPELNGMHWAWQGQYIFTALEGHSEETGYSYHLAGASTRRTITIPVDFRGGGPVTLDITMDAAAWLGALDMAKAGTSSHSRPGDTLAIRLADHSAHAFSPLRVSYDVFHPSKALATAEGPKGTTPYELHISQRFAAPTLPADNPLTEQGVALGKALFNDVRLSRIGTQSCASCHQEALAMSDDKVVSPGGEGQLGKRNAMPLFNLAWHKAFFWDGRAATLRQQVLMPVQDKHEMNASLEKVQKRLSDDDEYPGLFQAAFGSPGISSERMAEALEQYLLTQVSQDSKFDLAVRKQATLNAEEKRGLELFITEYDPKRGLYGADCFHCHGGAQFTNHAFTNNGLDAEPADTGRFAVTGIAADKGKFKTPSLRNVALTAPYMHDGRFVTLEQVVEHYSTGVKRSSSLDPNLSKHPETGLNLSAADKKALVAFLKTLTDERLLPKSSPTVATTR